MTITLISTQWMSRPRCLGAIAVGMVGHGWPWLAMVGHGWPWLAMVHQKIPCYRKKNGVAMFKIFIFRENCSLVFYERV